MDLSDEFLLTTRWQECVAWDSRDEHERPWRVSAACEQGWRRVSLSCAFFSDKCLHPDKVGTLSRSRSLFHFDCVSSTLVMFYTSLRNSFLLRADHGSAPSQGFTFICWDELWVTASFRLLVKTVGVLDHCDCGSDVILNVEAVPSVGVIDRSVLTADVDAGLGLISCEKERVGKIARLSLQRSCAWAVPCKLEPRMRAWFKVLRRARASECDEVFVLQISLTKNNRFFMEDVSKKCLEHSVTLNRFLVLHIVELRFLLNLCKPPPGPCVSFRRFVIQNCELSEFGPWVRQNSIHINVTIIIDSTFWEHIQIRMCSPGHVKVFQWSRNVSSFGT